MIIFFRVVRVAVGSVWPQASQEGCESEDLAACVSAGVFGADTDNTETVRVMLGDPVTLHTDLGTVRRDDHIVWVFGPDSPDNQIAELMKWSYMLSIYVSGKMPFRDALQLNHQTGSLTIKNTKSEHSGRYKLTIIHDRKTSRKRFDVIVYGKKEYKAVINC